MKAKQQRRLTYVKTLITLGIIILIGCSQEAFAQWATNGNNINNTNTGNVGVGTTTFNRAKLEISKDSGFNMAGGIEINAAGIDTGLALGADATNNIGWIQSLEPGVSFTTRPLGLQPNGGNVGVGTTNPPERLTAVVNDAVNNAITHVLTVGHETSSTPAAGMGSSLLFRSERSDGALAASGYIASIWEDPTTTTEDGALLFATVLNSAGYGTERMRITSTGNVGIRTTTPAAKLHVIGDVAVSGNIAAKYQDVAEWVPATRALAPGTVVALNPTQSNLVEASSKAYDTGVAGVISSQPGITLGERSENKVLVATTGRVLVKVDASRAPVQIGDLLVTSDNPGIAMKSEPVEFAGRKMHMPGTILGKALEPLAKGQGEILVLLSLQ
jgi:hypothetical protein